MYNLEDYDGPLPGTQAYYLQRWHEQNLLAHPDCRDPDHEGCDCCMEGDDDEQI